MMYRVVMVSSEPESILALGKALEAKDQLTVEWADSREKALSLASRLPPPDLMVVDEIPGGSADLELVREIMRANALIDVVMVSSLSDEAFHEAAEGLGVLMKLPSKPGAEEATAILSQLVRMGYLTAP